MKTHISILVFATLLAAASSLAAASKSPSAFVHSVRSVEHRDYTIVRGDASSLVLEALGAPARKLDGNVWIYPGFNAGAAQSKDDDCSTLMVTFTNGRVSDLKLVNDRAVAVIARRIEAGKAAGLVAATAK
jgi:hypothetical protein